MRTYFTFFLLDACRWLFIVHGCIDGFSRVITFLTLSTNNRSSTVLSAFKDAVGKWGLPVSVRKKIVCVKHSYATTSFLFFSDQTTALKMWRSALSCSLQGLKTKFSHILLQERVLITSALNVVGVMSLKHVWSHFI